MAQERLAEANWEGSLAEGSGQVTLSSSGAVGWLPVSWASRTENPDGQTSPEELIAAAHASCLAMVLSNVLAKADHPPKELVVAAACTIDKEDDALRITTMNLEVTGTVPGMDAVSFEKAVEEAAADCPVSNALKNNVEINVKSALS